MNGSLNSKMSVRPLFERLELRRFLSAGPLLEAVEVQSGPLPRVEDVHVSGSDWSQEFIDYLDERSLGDGPHGLRIDASPSYGRVLPWLNVNQVTIRMTFDMIVEADDLRVRGVASPTYTVTSVETSFDPDAFMTTATFTLGVGEFSKPDNLRFELDADPGGVRTREYGVPLDGDRNGTPGGDLVFRLTVVPGAANLGPYVDRSDYQTVRKALGRTIANRGTDVPFYHSSADLNADGRVNVTDLALVRSRLYTYAPLTAPQVAATADVGTEARTRPATRSLFSSTSILGT